MTISLSSFLRVLAFLHATLWVLGLSPTALAQRPIAFDHTFVDPANPVDPWGKTVGDINGDGRLDLVVGGYKSGGLLWYENPDWTPHVISGLPGFRTDHEAGDIDRDGLMDVVSLGWDSTGSAWLGWFKNPGSSDVWVPATVDSGAFHDVEIADLNADGKIDIIARDQETFGTEHGDTIYVYLQVSPTSWTPVSLPCTNGEGLKVADINRDGLRDIVINGTWFENTGDGSTWVPHAYTTTYVYRSVAIEVADINSDGRVDVILSPSEPVGGTYRLSWFEAPSDPSQPDWNEHVVEDNIETDHHSAGAADFDNDGLIDIATAEMNTGSSPHDIKIFLNGGGGLSWKKQVVATTGSHSMQIADFDGNGSKDLFGANWRGQGSELWLNQVDTVVVSLRVTGSEGAVQSLQLGLGRYATDSLDAVLGEAELAAPPPPGAFDVRFVGADGGLDLGRGTLRDFRRGDSATVGRRIHELRVQGPSGAGITISVDLPPQMTMRVQNLASGPIVDTTLVGRTSLVIPDAGMLLTLRLTVTYVQANPDAPTPEQPADGAQGVEAYPLLRWHSVEYCAGYHVQASRTSAFSGAMVVDTVVADTSLKLPLLASLSTYWWKVSAINARGEGEFSPPREFQTKEFVADPWTLGLWQLNEVSGTTIRDLSLHANDGIAHGTSSVEGRYGRGREFNGSSDYIDLPESASLLSPRLTLTTEAWIYLYSYGAPGADNPIVSTGNRQDYGFSVHADGRLAGHLYLSGGPESVFGNAIIPLQKWVHVAMTYDGSYVRFYVNGVLDATHTREGRIGRSPGNEDIAIGGYSEEGTFTRFFHGRMDDVRILRVARSPREFNLQLPPENVIAVSGPAQIGLRWTNGGGSAALLQYRVYRGIDSVTMNLHDSTRSPLYMDVSAAPLARFFYRVTAVDSTGFEGSASVAAGAVASLARPALLWPFRGEHGVDLTPRFAWAPVREATMYQLQVFADSRLYAPLADSATTDTALVLGVVLARGQQYRWRVRGLHDGQEGAWSEIREFVTVIQPASQTELVLPPNQSVAAPESVVCVWRSSFPAVERYWFEIASDSMFLLNAVDSLLTDTMAIARDLTSAPSYWWRVRAYNAAGWGPYSESRTLSVLPTAVSKVTQVPLEFGLAQNYPNPFNPSTTIGYGLPERSHVTLSVFNSLGQQVATLVEGEREAGQHTVTFDGSHLASGVYLYRLVAGEFVQARKLLLMK